MNPCRVLVWTTIYCNIVSFSPESFYGYVTLKDNLDVNSIYPTSSATVYQDTVAALRDSRMVVSANLTADACNVKGVVSYK